MKWIKIEDQKPRAGDEHLYLITDGKEISVGWHEDEYFAEDPKAALQYSSACWHDDAHLLVTGLNGWPNVTHWMPLPEPPSDDNTHVKTHPLTIEQKEKLTRINIGEEFEFGGEKFIFTGLRNGVPSWVP